MTVKPGWARKRPTAARPLPPKWSQWRLNRNEQRTLIIGFVGGLGSAVLGAVMKPGWARKRPTTARPLPPATEKLDRPREPEKRSRWRLNRDEQRTLIIGFVGGVGSTVLGAIFIGLAIGLVHASEAHQGMALFVLYICFWVAMGAIALFVVYMLIYSFRARRGRRTPFPIVPNVALALFSAAVGVALVGWIGVFAGIH